MTNLQGAVALFQSRRQDGNCCGTTGMSAARKEPRRMIYHHHPFESAQKTNHDVVVPMAVQNVEIGCC